MTRLEVNQFPEDGEMREQLVATEILAITNQINELTQEASRLTLEMAVGGISDQVRDELGQKFSKVVDEGVILSNRRATLFAQNGTELPDK